MRTCASVASCGQCGALHPEHCTCVRDLPHRVINLVGLSLRAVEGEQTTTSTLADLCGGLRSLEGECQPVAQMGLDMSPASLTYASLADSRSQFERLVRLREELDQYCWPMLRPPGAEARPPSDLDDQLAMIRHTLLDYLREAQFHAQRWLRTGGDL